MKPCVASRGLPWGPESSRKLRLFTDDGGLVEAHRPRRSETWSAVSDLTATDRSGQHRVRDGEGVDQPFRLGPDLVAEAVDLAGDRLAAGAGEATVLLEEGSIGLQVREREEVADALQGRTQGAALAILDGLAEGLEQHRVDVGTGGRHGVVL